MSHSSQEVTLEHGCFTSFSYIHKKFYFHQNAGPQNCGPGCYSIL